MASIRDALRSHREALNSLNVYPVPDGDTGSNMTATLESVMTELDGVDLEAGIDAVAGAIAPGSLMFKGGSWWKRREKDPKKIEDFIRTDMPYGRMGRPDEIGDFVAFLSSERAGLLNGACLNVDGGQSRSLI